MSLEESKSFPDSILYPCPAQWYVNGIAIALQQLDLPTPPVIPIQPSGNPGSYRSPIALAYRSQNPLELCQRINAIALKNLKSSLKSTDFYNRVPNPQKVFHLHEQKQGWVEMDTSLTLQIICIQHIGKRSLSSNQVFRPPNTPTDIEWELQYAHARCSSLLRLATEKFSDPIHLNLKPELNKWLQHHFSVSPSLLKTEIELWKNLLTFPLQLQDHKALTPTISTPSSIRITPLKTKKVKNIAHHWVKLFQKFYSLGPLFKFNESEIHPLLQVRMALLAGLQKVLRFLLTELFQIAAPRFL